jgi:hypothetical protein
MASLVERPHLNQDVTTPDKYIADGPSRNVTNQPRSRFCQSPRSTSSILNDSEDFTHGVIHLVDVLVTGTGKPNNLVVMVNCVENSVELRMSYYGMEEISGFCGKWVAWVIDKPKMRLSTMHFIVNQKTVWYIETG